MSIRKRWSKRFDVKVVPRRYLHLYRCFGWTPTVPTAIPQYDWEREGPNSARQYTSADISANLQDYDDLGLQRKEFVAVRRNTKFYQYKRQYPGFFRNERRFDRLMQQYTVGDSTKVMGLKQSFYIMRRVIFLIWGLLCLGVFTAGMLGTFGLFGLDQYVTQPIMSFLVQNDWTMAISFGVIAILFFFLAHQEIAIGRINHFEGVVGEEEDFVPFKHTERIVFSFRLHIFVLAGLACIYMFFVSFGLLPTPTFLESFIKVRIIGALDEENLNLNGTVLLYAIRSYCLTAGAVHLFIAIFNYNPYAWIKGLCLQARPITKKILFNDISMMSPQQRQRYNQGRIISSAVSDALDKREKGVREDFYIGY